MGKQALLLGLLLGILAMLGDLRVAALMPQHRRLPRLHPNVMRQRANPGAPPIAPLDPACVQKYQTDLVLPPPMPKTTRPLVPNRPTREGDNYHISVRKISQQVMPPQVAQATGVVCPAALTTTNLFAYGPADVPNTPLHNWPAFTIEATRGVSATVKWTNDLVDSTGRAPLRHILSDSIDQTIHWANPGALGTTNGAVDESPCHMCSMPGAPVPCNADLACVTAANTTYTGPVPMVTHVHGQIDLRDWSDGYTEAWYLPNAAGTPSQYNVRPGRRRSGTWYNTFATEALSQTGLTWTPGSAIYTYPNTQRPSHLWYHDHTLGLTRINVYSGMAGLYFVRDTFPSTAPELPGLPYPAYDGVMAPNLVREIPLAIQDRSFTNDSQLWYPVSSLPSVPTDGSLPLGPVPPVWIPEYSATVDGTNYLMFTVNGRTYPKHTVYKDAYRLRLLNGCNSRTLQLKFGWTTASELFTTGTGLELPPLPSDYLELPFWVVGNEDGFFPQLQDPVTSLVMGPAERFDVIIDFTDVPVGHVFMINNGPETFTAIYDGKNLGAGLTHRPEAASPALIVACMLLQIMRFDVTDSTGTMAHPFDTTAQEKLDTALKAQWQGVAEPPPNNQATSGNIRRVALLEKRTPKGNPMAVLLGVVADGANTAEPTLWSNKVASNGDTGANVYQVWDIINLSADSHPIHLHDVAIRFIQRTVTETKDGVTFVETPDPLENKDLDPLLKMPCTKPTNPDGTCSVPKDTIIVLPGATTRIGFYGPAYAGLYVWHCHLVEHEDNEMMVPLCFGKPPYQDLRNGGDMCPGPN